VPSEISDTKLLLTRWTGGYWPLTSEEKALMAQEITAWRKQGAALLDKFDQMAEKIVGDT